MEHHSHRNLGQVLLVQGLGRASRATTTSIRLAQLYAYGSESCLLIDLGSHGDATKRLGTTPTDSGLLGQLLTGQESAGRMGLLIRSVAPGLDLVPYDLGLEAMVASDLDPAAWAATLSSFRAQYDWIIVDCPPVGDKLGDASRKGATQWVVCSEDPEVTEGQTFDDAAQKFCQADPAGRRRTWRLEMAPELGREASVSQSWDSRSTHDRPNLWIPFDTPSQRGREAFWDDLETSFEQRATRAYVQLAKELKNSGRT